MASRVFSKDGPADFRVRSSEPVTTFFVQRSALFAASDAFQAMFDVCDAPESTWEDIGRAGKDEPQISEEMAMDMPEPPDVLEMLFKLIHGPPSPLPSIEDLLHRQYSVKAGEKEPELSKISSLSAVPIPLLRPLYRVADKYLLREELIRTLDSHLAAHVATQPLQVYAIATYLDLKDLAAYASSHLLSPSLDTYSPAQLSVLPSIESLHLLYILQAHRQTKLREVLSGESIFPHGYGRCDSRGHADKIEEAWRARKRYLLSMGRVTAGTDVALEMSTVTQGLECSTCLKACTAAIQLLEVRTSQPEVSTY